MTCKNAISLSDDAMSVCAAMRSARGPRFAIFGFNENNSQIVLLAASSPGEGHHEFIEKLPESDAAYGLFNFSFDHDDGTRRSRLCFITWLPKGTSRIRKFVAANSKHALHAQIPGFCVDFTASIPDDISEDALLEKCEPTVK